LREALRSLPVEPASPGFAAGALARARRERVRPGRGAFVAGFSSAAAIALVIWAVAGQVSGPTGLDETAGVRLVLAEQRDVNLVFDVPEAIRGAELSMQLPANVELAGFPDRRTLTWRTDLARGRNVLTLPVVGHSRTDGELIARISYGDKAKQFRVRLTVEDPQVRRGITGSGRQA